MIDQACSIKEHWRRLRMKVSVRIVIDKAIERSSNLATPFHSFSGIRRHRIPSIHVVLRIRGRFDLKRGTRDAFSILDSTPFRSTETRPRTKLNAHDRSTMGVRSVCTLACPKRGKQRGLYFEFLTKGNTTIPAEFHSGRV